MEIETKKTYGFISIFATIVGTVIGAGIFFKADSIYETTNSTITSMIAWIVVGFFVLIITAALIEIITSSTKTDESGTLSNWATKFVSPKFGSFVGLFLVFIYMPLTIVPLAYWTTDYIAEAIVTISPQSESVMYSFWMTILITFIIFALISAINYWSNRSSRIVQYVGTTVKLIPIIVILFSTIIFTFSNSSTPGVNDVSSIFDPVKNPAFSKDSGGQIFNTLILAMPAVLFAYDGFIYAGSLQNETKKSGTFKKAMISGMLFIALVYTLLSFGIYGSGSSTVNDGFSVSNVMNTVFPNQAWITPFIAFTIVISIGTGLNGFITSGNRSFTSLSETHLISDEKGKYLERSSTGVPKKSARKLIYINLFWFVILFIMSGILTASRGGSFDSSIIDIISEVGVTLSFFMISIILMGGLWNRKTNKVEVDKSSYFVPTAVTSIIFIIFIVLYQFVGFFIQGDSYYISVGILIIVAIIVLFFLTNYQVDKMEKKYKGKWALLCDYTSTQKADLNEDKIFDFEKMLSDSITMKKINEYNNFISSIELPKSQKFFIDLEYKVTSWNNSMNERFSWYGFKPYIKFYNYIKLKFISRSKNSSKNK